MKIKSLTIKNFKAFYGKYNFDFCDSNGKAENILIYGENGSGKTSLYWALYHMFYSNKKLQNIKKYKNIFQKENDIFIKLEFDNDEEIRFENGKFEKSNKIKDSLFEKIIKVKTFLSYKDLFLLNDLFKYETSIESFLSILKNVYGEDIEEKINEYDKTKQNFKENYFDKKCDIKEEILNFRNTYPKHRLLNIFIESDREYVDVEKRDEEGDFIGYDTVYYYSNAVVYEYDEYLKKLKKFNEDLEFKSYILGNIISELEDIRGRLYEKTEDSLHYKNSFYIEEIETINVLNILKNNLYFIIQIVENFDKFKEAIKNLNETLRSKLKEQVDDINEILKSYFKLDLEIELDDRDIFLFSIDNLDKFLPLKYEIIINGKKPKYSHLKFLNEAKISSINISFYISIVLAYAKIDEFKILILDDLLLSLDMSNRDIVLEIILKKFSNYQIIILSHDKAFFELAKRKFDYQSKNKWKYFEMYIDKVCNESIESPFIKEYGSDYIYIEKAKEHFKNKDYPACANYLRKEVEKQFDKYLKIDNLDEKIKLSKLKENEHLINDILKDFKKLNKTLENFDNCEKIPESIKANKCIEFSKKIKNVVKNFQEYIDNKFYFEEFEDVKIILKSILHPQSHDDISKPLYKKELEDAIKLVEELRALIK